MTNTFGMMKFATSGKEYIMIEKIAMWLILGGFVAMVNSFVAMVNGCLLLLVAYAISEM